MNRTLRMCLAACLALLLPSFALAQTTDQRLAEVEKKLDAALAEIEQLKLGGAASPDTAPAYRSRHGFAPGASRVYGVASGPSLGGYGEILFEASDATRGDGSPSGARPRADLLRTVFYVGHKFSPSLLLNSEIEWEHAGVRDEAATQVDPLTGAGDTELSGEATVEFAYLDWQVTPAWGVRAGKLLVPVGLVNEQHEPPVFLGARRPDTERFIVPSTWSAAGAGFYGRTATGLEWRALVVEGLDAAHFSAASAIRSGRQAGSQALFTHPAFAARLDWEGMPGVSLGVSGYTGDSWQTARPAGSALSARVTLTDAHVRAQWRGLQLRALYAMGALSDAAALSDALGLAGSDRLGERFWGGYAEAGYDLVPRWRPGSEWALIPYARYEVLDTQDDVPAGVADAANHRDVFTLGAAVKPHPNVVMKADREWRGNDADTDTNRWNLSFGWLF